MKELIDTQITIDEHNDMAWHESDISESLLALMNSIVKYKNFLNETVVAKQDYGSLIARPHEPPYALWKAKSSDLCDIAEIQLFHIIHRWRAKYGELPVNYDEQYAAVVMFVEQFEQVQGLYEKTGK